MTHLELVQRIGELLVIACGLLAIVYGALHLWRARRRRWEYTHDFPGLVARITAESSRSRDERRWFRG